MKPRAFETGNPVIYGKFRINLLQDCAVRPDFRIFNISELPLEFSALPVYGGLLSADFLRAGFWRKPATLITMNMRNELNSMYICI